MSADAADVRHTGQYDIYVSHLDYQLNRFYRNNGDGTFFDATVAAGFGQSNFLNSSFGARFFDFDNDGWIDLLVTNGHILDNIALYHPNATYAEVRKLYRNLGNGKFVDITSTQDASFRAPRIGRGMAVGDYDNDGWLDFLVNNNGEEAQLFHNDGGEGEISKGNHWLGVHLVGTKSNRDAIGVSLKLIAGDFISYDQKKGGMSFSSAQEPRVYFGLGAHAKIDALEIDWPSGLHEVIKDLSADQIVTIVEGQGISSYRYPTFHKK
jgi:hypothetical protein